MTQDHPPPAGDSSQWFQATHWSIILSLGRGSSDQATPAREALYRTYWAPIYAFIRRRGYSVEDAQDLTQDFLLHLLQKNAFGNLDPGKGKFRSFLLVGVKNFLTNRYDYNHAVKRGLGQAHVPLEEVEHQLSHTSRLGLNEEATFDRQWALALMDRALAQLREKQSSLGRLEQFEVLKTFLSREPKAGEYATLSDTLKMTDKAIAMAVHRLRQQYREAVKEEISYTVGSAAEAVDELRYLLAVLSR
jgi:RNA polymerase sigma-70 factor (ECF subfamily)